VQDLDGGQIQVAAIKPAISMEHVANPALKEIAETLTPKASGCRNLSAGQNRHIRKTSVPDR
jgi:hypothetical protein